MSDTPITDAATKHARELPTHSMEIVSLRNDLQIIERQLADALESKERILKRAEAIRCELVAVTEQRDQLLAALNRFDVDGLELEGDEEIDITMTAEDLRILRAAIAKAKGAAHE